jgi:hypothetical protein
MLMSPPAPLICDIIVWQLCGVAGAVVANKHQDRDILEDVDISRSEIGETTRLNLNDPLSHRANLRLARLWSGTNSIASDPPK